MSVRERPKKEKEQEEQTSDEVHKSDSNVEDWLDSVEIAATPSEQQSQKPSEQDIREPKIDHAEDMVKKFIQQLPAWISKPWMYVKPTHEGHLETWVSSWKELIISYCRALAKHIINIYDIQEVHPFTNRSTGRKLDLDQLEYIIQRMVDENLAKWLDKDMMARIYYKSDKEWSAIIYDYLLDTGRAAEVLTIYELKQLDEEWSYLPEEELVLIINILVNDQKAKWIGETKDAIKILY